MAKESAGAGRIGFKNGGTAVYGELLPEFSTELWVIERNLQLKGMYQQAVVELGNISDRPASIRKSFGFTGKPANYIPLINGRFRRLTV